ncbi:MAG: NimC/NimA family protein, partial [Lachnospiraceae bacterium]|nr:NimC/NimA family protein [Lachnospiraceae bacterium]
ICGMHEGRWIRVEGVMKEDLRREARVAMLEDNPSLKGLADPDNGTMTVFYFESGTATIYSFTEAPKVITL